MIGRYTQPGTWRRLLSLRSFLPPLIAGALALASFIIDFNLGRTSLTGDILALTAVAINGLPIVWGAMKGLAARQFNVDELVSLAIIASVIQGEYLTAAVVSLVMILGALIEEATAESARRAIGALMELRSRYALRLARDDDDRAEEVPIEQVAEGDRLLVRPGDSFPVDGDIISGRTSVDESPMTGEAMPVAKAEGDAVLAGTNNQSAKVIIIARRVGDRTALSRIIELVREAEAHKPEAIRLIDRYAKWFTPAILSAAGLTWLLTGMVDRAVAVLIAGCPCALILAAPTAVVAALGRAARAGVLVKGGAFLESVAAARVVLFDKTGTLTLGRPVVNGVYAVNRAHRDEVLACAAGAESECRHPLARAVLDEALRVGVEIGTPDSAEEEVGLGVSAVVNGARISVGSLEKEEDRSKLPPELAARLEYAESRGSTPLVVFRNDEPLGLITVTDQLRDSAPRASAGLRRLGLERIGVLSGDHRAAARRAAELAGLDPDLALSRLKPGDKLDIIRRHQAQGRKVIYVGDGINDAPALARADVGLAMGAVGTEAALETADAALTRDDLTRLPFLIRLCRRMLTIIKWNIGFGLTFNAAAVLAGGWGLLSPIGAAIVHNVGSVAVVIASASLALTRDEEG